MIKVKKQNAARQKQKQNTTSLHPIEYSLSKSLESDTYFKGDEIELKLQQAILTLPEKQRLTMHLRDIEGMAYDEIAESLEISLAQVKVNLHRARQFIKEKMLLEYS